MANNEIKKMVNEHCKPMLLDIKRLRNEMLSLRTEINIIKESLDEI
tara:strand:- start:2076 stop:2213 length:138 start_codon:yes stop_codon:yes gene_type:complete